MVTEARFGNGVQFLSIPRHEFPAVLYFLIDAIPYASIEGIGLDQFIPAAPDHGVVKRVQLQVNASFAAPSCQRSASPVKILIAGLQSDFTNGDLLPEFKQDVAVTLFRLLRLGPPSGALPIRIAVLLVIVNDLTDRYGRIVFGGDSQSQLGSCTGSRRTASSWRAVATLVVRSEMKLSLPPAVTRS